MSIWQNVIKVLLKQKSNWVEFNKIWFKRFCEDSYLMILGRLCFASIVHKIFFWHTDSEIYVEYVVYCHTLQYVGLAYAIILSCCSRLPIPKRDVRGTAAGVFVHWLWPSRTSSRQYRRTSRCLHWLCSTQDTRPGLHYALHAQLMIIHHTIFFLT